MKEIFSFLKNRPEQFTSAVGRESSVRVKGKKLISENKNARVYRAQVEVLGDAGGHRERTFVMKKYLGKDAASRASETMSVHSKLRELGVNTWTTYREGEKGDEILMTDGEVRKDDWVITMNNRSAGHNKLAWMAEEIQNRQEAFDWAAGDALRAAAGGVKVFSTAWMMRIRIESTGNEGRASIHLSIGDLDDVLTDAEETPDELEKFNRNALEEAFRAMSIATFDRDF